MLSSEHFSKQFDADLEDIRSRVMQMGGVVESQIMAAISGFASGDLDVIARVIDNDRQVDAYELQIDEATCPAYILSHNGVFTDKIKAVFDDYARQYGRILSHQSDRQFSRAYFPSGITSNAKKNGHEEQSVLLLSLLIFVSQMGDTFDRAIDLKTSKNSVRDDEATLRSTAFVDMLSKTLLMHNFLKQPSVLKSAVIDFEKYVPVYLDSFKRVVDRKIGMGMKISKFHFPTHHADDIKRFGPATSWDSSTGESNHIGLKGAARHTQKITKIFDVQTAQRYHENHVIASAHSLLKATSSETQCDMDIQQTKTVSRLTGKSYYISDGCLFNSFGRMVDWRASDMQKRVLNLVHELITPNVRPPPLPRKRSP